MKPAVARSTGVPESRTRPAHQPSGEPMTNIVLGTVAIVAAATFAATTDSTTAEAPAHQVVVQH